VRGWGLIVGGERAMLDFLVGGREMLEGSRSSEGRVCKMLTLTGIGIRMTLLVLEYCGEVAMDTYHGYEIGETLSWWELEDCDQSKVFSIGDYKKFCDR
jgi:hypothetical protein